MNLKADFPTYPLKGSYFDSFTLGLQPHNAIDAQIEFLKTNGSTSRKSLYARMRENLNFVTETRELISAHFGTLNQHVSFLPNLDYSYNILLDTLIRNSKTKLVFATTIFEDNSILAPLIDRFSQGKINLILLQVKEDEEISAKVNKSNVKIDYLLLNHISPVFSHYRNFKKLKSQINSNTKIIADLSRSAGQYTIDLQTMKLDYVLIDGSGDLLGPPGVSLLIFPENDNLTSLTSASIIGSNAISKISHPKVTPVYGAEKFEVGHHNLLGIIGLRYSLEYLRSLGIGRIVSQQRTLNRYLFTRLHSIDQLSMISSINQDSYSNMFNFTIQGVDSNDLAMMLDESFNIEIRSGLMCSHLAMKYLNIENMVQVSTHIYNSEIEVDNLVNSLIDVANKFS